MNCMRKSLNLPFCCFNFTSKHLFNGYNSLEGKLKNVSRFYHESQTEEQTESQILQPDSQNSEKPEITPYLHRELKFCHKYLKPKEVWVENFDTIKEEKRGLVELHPKIFGTIPRLDLIHTNVKWQTLYNKVILYNAKSRAEERGGGRKPHRQKGLGKARQGSIRAPHLKGGGSCHGPRNPTSYFFVLPYHTRIHGLTSTFSAKLAQDDLHVVDDINIPTENSQFILDLIKERHWGSSVLIVDKFDIMPRNITIATDTIEYVNLMPVYGLNVYSMLKHETLVLTIAAVEEIEKQLIELLYSANPLDLAKKFDLERK